MYVDILAVLIATLAGFGVGALWYSPYLFGKEWSQLMGYGSSMDSAPPGRFTPMQAMGIELALTFVTAYALAIFVDGLNADGPFRALRLGFWIWLGFQATVMFSGVLFERRSLRLFYISAGHRLAAILLMTLIIGLWP